MWIDPYGAKTIKGVFEGLGENGILSALSSADLTSNYAFAWMAHCLPWIEKTRTEGLCIVFIWGEGGGRKGGGVRGLNKYRGKCESGYYSFIGLHYNQTSQ